MKSVLTFPSAPPMSRGSWAMMQSVCAICVLPVLNSPYTSVMLSGVTTGESNEGKVWNRWNEEELIDRGGRRQGCMTLQR